MTVLKFQIGKNGITPNVIESLSLAFKKHKQVRISVLKSAVRDKERVKEMAEEIKNALGENYAYRVIGFTIIMRKTSRNPSLSAPKRKG